jgi:hypothetical protein
MNDCIEIDRLDCPEPPNIEKSERLANNSLEHLDHSQDKVHIEIDHLDVLDPPKV